ncbi:outer membrane protein assembly factor BamB family protein [Streptomyces sp. SP18CS02]|uniref:outer membrane protein assembly factor BamB family protein n=1 Tax=Streptomyces sp. SP18CS02 TaxID=3002531 RepID=UPI003FCD5D0E
MQPLRPDDPRRIGPYTVLALLRESAGAVRYLARGAGGQLAVVAVPPASLARLPAFRRRFAAEARTSERLAGGWVPEPLGAADDERGLWTATAYVPSLTLGEAVSLAGPLPARTVRILGAGLAETLSRVHATGAVLHGLAPGTVLLAADGPRLVAFGALGAAESAEARPGGRLSVRLGYLTPEQVAGEQPGRPSDVFVLGLLLAYAATGRQPFADAPDIGRAEPELGSVPESLRPLIARCLAKSPDERPAAGTVAAELALEGAAALARGGWLPGPLEAALSGQASRAAELGGPWEAAPEGTDTPPAGPGDDGGPGPDARTVRAGRPRPAGDRAAMELVVAPPRRPALPPAPPLPPATAPAGALPVPFAPGGPLVPTAPAASGAGRLSRRSLLTGVAAGAAGAVVGGAGVLALTSGGDGVRADAKPPAPRRPAPPGLPPQPRWAYENPATPGGALNATVWRGRTLVLTSDAHTTAVDLGTGRRLWQHAGSGSAERALPAGTDLLFVAAATEFQWLSPTTGRVEHRVRHRDGFPGAPGLSLSAVAGQAGPVVWFTATALAGAPPRQTVRTFLFAFDVVRRKELWRAPVPDGRAPHTPAYTVIAVRPDAVVVRQDRRSITPAQNAAAKGLAIFHSYDRVTGTRQWFRPFGTALPGAEAVGDETGRLFAAIGGDLYAYDTRSRRALWRMAGVPAAAGTAPYAFGRGELRDGTLYIANRFRTVYAVDAATGRPRWRRGTEAPAGQDLPRVTPSASGRTLLAADSGQVTAFGAADGRRLWKFQNAGASGPPSPRTENETAAPYTALAATGSVVVRRDRMFYALPVE